MPGMEEKEKAMEVGAGARGKTTRGCRMCSFFWQFLHRPRSVSTSVSTALLNIHMPTSSTSECAGEDMESESESGSDSSRSSSPSSARGQNIADWEQLLKVFMIKSNGYATRSKEYKRNFRYILMIMAIILYLREQQSTSSDSDSDNEAYDSVRRRLFVRN